MKIVNVTAVWLFISIVLLISFASAGSPLYYSKSLSRISSEEGLSQSSVTKVIKDDLGYLWIGTQMGLNRYDGYSVKNIQGPNGVFEQEIISSLYKDSDGYIWIGTSFSGLFRLDPSTLKTTSYFSGQFADADSFYSEVLAIEQQDETRFWIAISERLYILNIEDQSLTKIFELSTSDDIIRALKIHQGVLYVGTSEGLFTLDLITHEHKLLIHKPSTSDSENANNVKALLFVDEQLLVGTVDGLFSVTKDTKTNLFHNPTSLVADLNIWQIEPYADQYFLGTDRGLYLFDLVTNTNKFVLDFESSLFQTTDNNIFTLYLEDAGALWMGSNSHGVLKWNLSTINFERVTSSYPYKLSNDNVWALIQGADEYLWVGTDNGLNRVDLSNPENTVVLFHEPDEKKRDSVNYVSALYRDSETDDYLWLVNDNGLYKFNTETFELEAPFFKPNAFDGMTDTWFSGLFINDNQNIFFFTLDGHFHYNSTTGVIKKLKAFDHLDPDLSYTFIGHYDGPEKTFFSTSGHLYEYDLKTDTLTLVYRVTNYQPQSFSIVDDWILDDKGLMWFGMSGEGLIAIDKQTFEVKHKITVGSELASSYLYGFAKDDLGFIWFSSQSGLYKLDTQTMHLTHFNASDGLLSTEFNAYSYEALSNNRFAFGSPRGVTLFNADDLASVVHHDTYQVRFTELSLMSDASRFFLADDERIELAYDDFGLNIFFSTLDYHQITSTSFTIALVGEEISLHWQDYKQNHLLLPKLSAGTYNLSVVAEHPLTGEQSTTAHKVITVDYAPWASPMAKWSYFLVSAVILWIYYLHRSQRNAVLKSARQRAEFNERRMELALASSNSGVWEYDAVDGKLYQEALYKELGYDTRECCNTIEGHFALVKQSKRKQLEQKWQQFIRGETEYWDEVYQLLSASNVWTWYKYVGKAIDWDKDGKPIKFSGTYTNVNATKVIEEQALIFGSAFSQINDWVLILDKKMQPLTANEAFIKAFDLSEQDVSQSLRLLLAMLEKNEFKRFRSILKSLKPKDNWQGEAFIEVANQQHRPVLIKVTAITDAKLVITHYVVVISDITAQKEAEERLNLMAHYDHLTSLPNRKLFHERVTSSIQDGIESFALLFIDLDKFKQVNDLYSHKTGDLLLVHVADTLTKLLGHRGVVARQSGDEFLAQIYEYHSVENVSLIAQEIITALAQVVVINNQNINISSSIGVAIYPNDAGTTDALIQKADLAMIYAKNHGKNQFQFYTHDMNDRAHRRLVLENRLEVATLENTLVNFYQPIVDIQDIPEIVGCELLLRWYDGEESIMPSEFIPVAEETGLIKAITINAIERAAQDYVKYFSHLDSFYISINLSPIHLLQDGLVESLLLILKTHSIPTSVFRLEITESAVLSDLEVALERLRKLRENGFKLLLDDFGTGYSSMTYLSRFPIQYIKIDKSFIFNIHEKANRSIVQSIIFLASNMGLKCIAEGVEEKSQLEVLKQMGCHLVQGFYYSKPQPPENILAINFEGKSASH